MYTATMRFCRALIAFILLGSSLTAHADNGCAPGNLLANREPLAGLVDGRGLATDGTIAPEGAIWDAPLAVKLPAGSGLVYDLGQMQRISMLYLQADANDRYKLLLSEDGQSFRTIADFGPLAGHGLRSREQRLEGAPGRYLALEPLEGDGLYSVSELAIFCQIPASLDTIFQHGTAVLAGAPVVASGIHRYWNDTTSLRWELALALIGLILLLKKPAVEPKMRLRADRALAALGLLSGLSYFNFGFFHFGNYIHNWDTFHYYIGAKYFPQLGYEHLYECMTVADIEDGYSATTPQTKITDLRTNHLQTAADIIHNPERCTAHFSGQRWQDFKQDINFFRSRENAGRWEEMRTDHGFNATPVWLLAGNVLANLAPASQPRVLALTLIDPIYWLACCGVIAWAFGWRVLCIASLVFATFVPARFYWTGGSFLRWDWLFFMVAAVCCLKKERPLLGGAALGYSMLLRVFPGTLFLGPVLFALGIWLRERRLDRKCFLFCLGGFLVVALLLPLSALRLGSLDVYPAFVRNSIKHTQTPLTNNLGLRTVLSYRPGIAGHYLRDGALLDPWENWKEARLKAFKQARPVYPILVLGFVVLFWRALRRAEPWTATALAVTLIPAFFELTGYYYAFVLALALLAAQRPRYGLWLLALSTVSGLLTWAPLPFMPGWLDEQCVWLSIATLFVFAALLWDFGGAETGPAQVS